MSFVFNNCSIGDGAQFITVEAGASLTLNLGGGYRTTTTTTNSSTRCPLKLAEYKTQLKGWAQRCINAQAPEGFNTETWGGSPKVFDDGVAPSGLNKGDTLFFWKSGVVNPTSEPTPKGFEAVYAKDGVLIVVPTPGDNDTVPDVQDNCPTTPNTDQADTDADDEDQLSGADASLGGFQDSDPWDDDDEEDGGEPTTGLLGDDEDDDDEDESLDF